MSTELAMPGGTMKTPLSARWSLVRAYRAYHRRMCSKGSHYERMVLLQQDLTRAGALASAVRLAERLAPDPWAGDRRARKRAQRAATRQGDLLELRLFWEGRPTATGHHPFEFRAFV